MTSNYLTIANKNIKEVVLNGSEKPFYISVFQSHKGLELNKKSIKKYLKYAQYRLFEYVSYIMDKNKDEVELLMSKNTEEDILHKKNFSYNYKNIIINGLVLSISLSLFLGGMFSPLLTLLNKDFYDGLCLFIAPIVCIGSLLVGYKQLKNLRFFLRTGYDISIFHSIKRNEADKIAVTNNGLYIFSYEYMGVDLAWNLYHKKYDYRDILYVRMENHETVIKVIGFSGDELFSYEFNNPEQCKELFSLVELKVANSNKICK